MTSVEISKLGKVGLAAIGNLLNKKPESVISMNKDGKVWKIMTEVLERRAVPDSQDLLGRYELTMDEKGVLLGYKQVLTKKRADTITEEE